MKIRGFCLAVAFLMERQIYSSNFSFTFAFVINMLGTHRPRQQQATITKKRRKSPEISFRFRNPTERENPKSWDFYFLFARNRMCEDGVSKKSRCVHFHDINEAQTSTANHRRATAYWVVGIRTHPVGRFHDVEVPELHVVLQANQEGRHRLTPPMGHEPRRHLGWVRQAIAIAIATIFARISFQRERHWMSLKLAESNHKC